VRFFNARGTIVFFIVQFKKLHIDDRAIERRIFDELQNADLGILYLKVTLKGKLSSEYEFVILKVLSTARVMLVILNAFIGKLR